MNTFGMRAYYRPNYFSRINVEYHTTNEFRRGGNKFNLQPHEADITEQTKHIINSGGVSYDRYWGEKHKMSVYGSIQHTDRNSYYGAQKDMNAYGKTNDLTWVVGGMYVGNMDRCFCSGYVYRRCRVSEQLTTRCDDGISPRHAAGCAYCRRFCTERMAVESLDDACRGTSGQA